MPTTATQVPATDSAPRETVHEVQLRQLRTALARREVAVPVETHTALTARNLHRAGVRPGMIVHDATAGSQVRSGALKLGATVVTAEGLSVERHAALIADLGAQVLCCSPSLAAQLADVLGRTALELGVFGGETLTPALAHRLESTLRIKALGELVIDGRRTGDFASLTAAPCACGVPTARLLEVHCEPSHHFPQQ